MRVDRYGRPVNEYDIGDNLVINMTFTDPATGNEVTPFLCTVSMKDPGGVSATYEFPGTDPELVWVINGQYICTVPLTTPGTWYYRIAGTGNGQSAEEREVDVRQSYF